MPATKRFIEDAVKGGYAEDKTNHWGALWEILLDPRVWNAVAKHRKWESLTSSYYDTDAGKERMHLFIDMLWEGKTIESALKELEK